MPLGETGLGRGLVWTANDLGDQLVDRHVPGDLADGDHRGLLALIELDDPPWAIISQAGHDHAVARLESSPRLAELHLALPFSLKV